MAAYNRKDILVKAIGKIMEMDYPKAEYEVIVGDNNSTDGTLEVMKDFAEKNKGKLNLKYLVEKRRGNIYARHSAVSHSTGKYLVFCDDDCLVPKNWLPEIERAFNKFPVIGLLGTRIDILWDTTPPTWIKKYQYCLGEIAMGEGITVRETGMYVNSGSMAIPKTVFEKVKGTNPEQIGDFYVGDGETGLCRKLHKLRIPIAFTNDTTVLHFQVVAKNGSENDIGRRFYNNGICESYNRAVVDGQNTLGAAIVHEKSLKRSGYTRFWRYLKEEDKRQFTFDLNYAKGKVDYLKALNENPELKKSLDLKDWIYDEKYNAPALTAQATFFNN